MYEPRGLLGGGGGGGVTSLTTLAHTILRNLKVDSGSSET